MEPRRTRYSGHNILINNNIFKRFGLHELAGRAPTNALHLEPQSPVNLDDAPRKEVVLEDKPDRMGNLGRLA